MAALGTALVALIFACAWGWVANRRLKLLSAWRANVTHLDGVVDRHGIYLRVEPHAGQTPWRTPSGLTARFPWLVSLLWIAAVIWLLALLVQGQS